MFYFEQSVASLKLMAFHIEHTPVMFNGYVVPLDNVATIFKGANIIKNDQLQALPNREILIQLGQPYYIDSLRILFWEVGKRNHFYVETSLDMKTWSLAVDNRNGDIVSSPVFQFIIVV